MIPVGSCAVISAVSVRQTWGRSETRRVLTRSIITRAVGAAPLFGVTVKNKKEVVEVKFNLDRRIAQFVSTCAALDEESVDIFVTRALADHMAATLEWHGKEMSREFRDLGSVDTPG